jgi:hypothetical protein
MSYQRRKPNSGYEQHRPKPHIQKLPKGKVQTEKTTEWKFDLLRRTPSIKKKEKEEIETNAEAIEKEHRTSLAFEAGNPICNGRIFGTKENTEKVSFTSQKSRKSKRPKGMDYV